MAIAVEQSRAIPVGVEDAFAGTLPFPLPVLAKLWQGYARRALAELSALLVG
ncbi:MAG: hypothetical protein ACRDTN_14970 [Mycobacterium sp.]